MIEKEGDSIYARNGSARKPDQPFGFRRNKLANPNHDKQGTDGPAQCSCRASETLSRPAARSAMPRSGAKKAA